MKRSIAIVVALSSCLPWGAPPARPTYGADCRPSHEDFEVLARSERDMFASTKIAKDPAEAYADAVAEAKRRNLTLRVKRANENSAWDGFSTTLPGTILLESDWEARSVEDRAAVLWHELVHARQYQRLGAATFLAFYAVPEGRWALEVPAYAMSDRTYSRMGYPDKALLAHMAERAERMYVKYKLTAMPACTTANTEQIWRAAFAAR